MLANNFIKEIFWKNDLVYLCLCLPLIASLTFATTFGFFIFIVYSVIVLSTSLLVYSWVMTLKKRYIFNSRLKCFLLVFSLLAVNNYLTSSIELSIVSSLVKLSIEFSSIFTYVLFVVNTAYCLGHNASENHEGEYDPTLTDQYQGYNYLPSIYSCLHVNNTYKYHYDRVVDVYIFDEIMYQTSDQTKGKISTVKDYLKYLSENKIAPHQVTQDEFLIFRMIMI